MNCPICGSIMKPLAFSNFCPNDCDRKSPDDPKSIEFVFNGELWKMALIRENEECPAWATHRWYVYNDTKFRRSLDSFATEWNSFSAPEPGWCIADHPEGNKPDPISSVIFARISK